MKIFLFFRKLLSRICAIGVFDKDKPSFKTLKSKSGVFCETTRWGGQKIVAISMKVLILWGFKRRGEFL